MISRRRVEITDEALASVDATGLAAADKQRLLRHVENALTGPLADDLRRKRVADDPECFEYRNVLSGPDALHLFTFRINDVMLANVLIIESAAHEMRPLRRRDG